MVCLPLCFSRSWWRVYRNVLCSRCFLRLKHRVHCRNRLLVVGGQGSVLVALCSSCCWDLLYSYSCRTVQPLSSLPALLWSQLFWCSLIYETALTRLSSCLALLLLA